MGLSSTIARFFVLFLITIAFLLNFGCNPLDDRAAEKAEAENTIESYEEYLKKYPEGYFAEQAKENIETLSWEASKEIDSIESYENYLKEYPVGLFASQAKENIDKLSWEASKEIDSIESYESYLKYFPEGSFVKEAKMHVISFQVNDVLDGEGIDKAAEFNRNESGPHKLVILNEDGSLLKEYVDELPNDWIATHISETELVVIIQSTLRDVGSCSYIGAGSVVRQRHRLEIEIREAKTGQIFDKTFLDGSEPRKCPTYMVFHPGEGKKFIEGDSVSGEKIVSWISDIVDP